DPSRAIPRGPVLPAQRGANPVAAAARTYVGYSGVGAPFRNASSEGGVATEDARRCRDGAAPQASLAGKCPRTGKPDTAAGGPLFGRDHRRRRHRSGIGRRSREGRTSGGSKRGGGPRRRRAPTP